MQADAPKPGPSSEVGRKLVEFQAYRQQKVPGPNEVRKTQEEAIIKDDTGIMVRKGVEYMCTY